MPNGIPIGFEMAEKKLHRETDKQTNKQFRIYISRDEKIAIILLPSTNNVGLSWCITYFKLGNTSTVISAYSRSLQL